MTHRTLVSKLNYLQLIFNFPKDKLKEKQYIQQIQVINDTEKMELASFYELIPGQNSVNSAKGKCLSWND